MCAGSEAPFIVVGDGGSTAYKDLATTLDNLIAQRRVPPMIAIQIGNGGQDAQGSQRGREYDAVSGAYAQFVEREVLPLVEQNAERQAHEESRRPRDHGAELERSGGLHHGVVPSRALSPGAGLLADHGEPAMAARSVTARRRLGISQRVGGTGRRPISSSRRASLTPSDPPGAPLIPSAPTKPIRFWFFVGDQDLFYPNPTIPDGMHDWTLSNELMAKVLADKGYHYQFLFVAQRQARRSPDDRADAAVGAGMALEGLSDSLDVFFKAMLDGNA